MLAKALFLNLSSFRWSFFKERLSLSYLVLFANLVLASLFPKELAIFYTLLTFSSFVLPSIFLKGGLSVFSGLIVLFMIFEKSMISSVGILWVGGALVSLLLTAFLFFLESEEKRERETQRERGYMEKCLALEKLLNEKEEEYEEALDRLKEEIKQLEKEAAQRQIDRQMLESIHVRLREDMEQLNVTKEEIIRENLEVREALRRTSATLSRELSPSLEEGQVQLSELQKKERLLKQLKMQFEEKRAALAEARRELFLLEGKLHNAATLNEEKERESLEENPYFHEMRELLKERVILQDEIKTLEALISRILTP